MRVWYEPEKKPLAILLDNSSSVDYFKSGDIASKVYNSLKDNSDLADRFEIRAFTFDQELNPDGEVNFKGVQTNIQKAAKNIKSLYRNKEVPTILITDGNATSGGDYTYTFDQNTPVHALVLGDTTQVADLKISQLNANKYAFLKNHFPVEVFTQYIGRKNQDSKIEIKQNGKVIASQKLNFSSGQTSQIVNFQLTADRIGLQIYEAVIQPMSGEANTINNRKTFAVEVIDQRSEIAIVSAINHPDISGIKRAIETNSQRKVSIISPKDLNDVRKFQLIIAYQPNPSFSEVVDKAVQANVNLWFISGNQTDFAWMNSKNLGVGFKMSSQPEYYTAQLDKSFGLFTPEELNFSELPPLEHPFGSLQIPPGFNTLLQAEVRGVGTGSPLFGFIENKGQRFGYLFGEGIWKWRLNTYVQTQSFETFDRFIDKSVQYLVSDNSRKSLVVNHERFYNSGEPIQITAQYFDKNYQFDSKARLQVVLTNRQTKKSKMFEMLRAQNQFELNLEGIPAGAYDISVKELTSNATYSGYIELLDFEIEKQFVNPDYQKLSQVAQQTKGSIALVNQWESLVKQLLEDNRNQIVEKKMSKRLPLVDQWFLLVILIVSLAAEWFIRKYNGML